jgi:hypothetical protein
MPMGDNTLPPNARVGCEASCGTVRPLHYSRGTTILSATRLWVRAAFGSPKSRYTSCPVRNCCIDGVCRVAQKRARRELSRPTLHRVIKRVDTQGFCPFRLVYDSVYHRRLHKPLRRDGRGVHELRPREPHR